MEREGHPEVEREGHPEIERRGMQKWTEAEMRKSVGSRAREDLGWFLGLSWRLPGWSWGAATMFGQNTARDFTSGSM